MSKLKCKTRKKRKHKLAISMTLLVVFFICYYIFLVSPLLIKNIKISAQKNLLDAMNYSITKTANSDFVYNKMITITYDNDGTVNLIQTNMNEINKIYAVLGDNTEEYIKNYNNSFKIKMGNFTGLSILSGLGPQIKFNIDTINSVKCDFHSSFTSTGINQTLHSIYVDITVSVGVVLPFTSCEVLDTQQFLLCESVIVGKIPEVYLFSDNLDSLFNFVPI